MTLLIKISLLISILQGHLRPNGHQGVGVMTRHLNEEGLQNQQKDFGFLFFPAWAQAINGPHRGWPTNSPCPQMSKE